MRRIRICANSKIPINPNHGHLDIQIPIAILLLGETQILAAQLSQTSFVVPVAAGRQ